MGKWNSTFSRFWLIAGIFCILVHKLMAPLFWWVFGAVFLFFLIIEFKIVKEMIKRPKAALPCVIVLGAKVNGTRVSESLRRRLERTVVYMEKNPQTIAIVSGSRLGGELITEAEAMERYLIEKGIEERRIIKEEQSYTTQENLKLSKELLPDEKIQVGIITSNYHVYRSLCYAKILGYNEPVGISATTHPVLFPNYMVREFFAILKLFWLTKKITML